VRAAVDIDDAGVRSSAPDEPHRIIRGTLGSVVGVGRHAKAVSPVYLVEFAGAVVVGCREGELDAVAPPAARRCG